VFFVRYESQVVTPTALVNFLCSTSLTLICRDLVAFMRSIILWFDVRLPNIQTDLAFLLYAFAEQSCLVIQFYCQHFTCSFTDLHIAWRSAFWLYNRINSTKSPAPGAGNMREARLMSLHGRVHEVVCAYISGFLQSELYDGFDGLVVSMLASGSRVRGFEPDRSRWIFFRCEKFLCMPSFGGEVK
jgi:hypothetical protein